ncbi:MAG: hypothetical protein WBL35_10825 [Ornithinibacter sp.]
METMTMSEEMAMAAVRETSARPWRGSNTAHAGIFGQFQGRTLSFVGCTDLAIDDRANVTAPITGVGYPRLEAPPV